MTKVHDSVLSVPDTGRSDIRVLLMTMYLRVALLRQVRAPLSFVGSSRGCESEIARDSRWGDNRRSNGSRRRVTLR